MTLPSASPRRVLVVDDNKDASDMLVMLLDQLGFAARAAYSGESAVRDAETFRPDFLLLDLGMADIDGYEACRRIRAQSWGASMTIIALSGWSRDEDRRESMASGFNAHLVKPLDLEALLRVFDETSSADASASSC